MLRRPREVGQSRRKWVLRSWPWVVEKNTLSVQPGGMCSCGLCFPLPCCLESFARRVQNIIHPNFHTPRTPRRQSLRREDSCKHKRFMQTQEMLRTHSSGAEGSFQPFLHPGNLGTLRAKARMQLGLSRKRNFRHKDALAKGCGIPHHSFSPRLGSAPAGWKQLLLWAFPLAPVFFLPDKLAALNEHICELRK